MCNAYLNTFEFPVLYWLLYCLPFINTNEVTEYIVFITT